MNIELKKRIMLRVYSLYALKKLQEPFIGEAFLLSISFILLFFFVSVSHVISNIILTRGSYHFLLDAFAKTQVTVKLLVVSLLFAGGVFVRNITLFTTQKIKGRFV